jgi:hypothetical protein
MVYFQIEFNMLEHVFHDLKAVEDTVAFFFSPTSALLMHIITCTILSTVWNK